jgi:phosphatidylglycerol---prolipoprotein diacylglyceryl transferase
MDYWVHDLSPFALEFREGFGIRWYGLAYLAAFASAAALLWIYHRRGRFPLGPTQQSDALITFIIGVLVGGRFGHFLLYEPGTLFTDPLAFFRVWEGGMASHGGFLGVVAAIFWIAWRNRLSPLQVGDVATSIAPAGIFFGRLANFINGELWGRVTDVRWAVIFPQSEAPGTPLSLIEPRHPSQLYQAGLEGLLLFAYLQWRFWRTDIIRRAPGQLAGEMLIGYSIFRIIGESFREPEDGMIGWLTAGQFYTLFLAAGGIALIVVARQRARKTAK